MSDNRAVPTVQLENEHLRVTEWCFAPGAATGWHRHPHDYVVVPVVDGELELVGPAHQSPTRRRRPLAGAAAEGPIVLPQGRRRARCH